MDFTSAAVSAIMVVLGVVLGLLAEPVSDHFRRRRQKKHLATILSSEVWIIRMLALSRIPTMEEMLKESEIAKESKTICSLNITDSHLPSTIYRSSLNSLGMLDDKLVSDLAYLYSLVDQVNRFVEQNLIAVSDFNAFVGATSGRELTKYESEVLGTRGFATIHLSEAYLNSLRVIVNLADDSLRQLGGISPYEPRRRAFAEISKIQKLRIEP